MDNLRQNALLVAWAVAGVMACGLFSEAAPRCKQTGFRGRTLIAEALEVTPEIGAALRRGASADELRTIAVGQGMKTMAAHGILRAAAGETTLAEVLRVAPTL
jgi:type II secretory ATPase GspE/PulE/Tfp pilus assembly ATPase PilB-like protein